MAVDVLSDVLRVVRLSGAVFFDFELTAPWVAEAPPSTDIAAMVMPGSDRVIEYHLIASGAAWGHAVGEPPVHLREGDLLIFPQGDPHVLSSAPGMRARPDFRIYARQTSSFPLMYELGGGGDDRARVVCGFLGLDDRPYNPLLTALPRTIHLPASRTDKSTLPLASLLDIASRESRRGSPGAENVLGRISELIFVEAVRRYLAELPAQQQGWLAGLRDPIVGKALASLHAAPRDVWTVESLGRAVGVSRSVLAARFNDLVGLPPMQYLAMWRMQLAAGLLREGRQVVDVAAAVGYESEAAFSRAFKKLMGESPVTWKRGSESVKAGA